MILLSTFPVVAAFLIFARKILGLFFGVEFVSAYAALAILCLGQVVSATMGIVSLLLAVTGYEKDIVRVAVITAAMNVGLNLIFIPAFGMNGAAAATAVTLDA